MTENRTKEEIANDAQIPTELKEKLNEKVQSVLNNIGMIEKKINTAIDDAVEELDGQITATELNAALLNVMRKLNQQEIMQIIN